MRRMKMKFGIIFLIVCVAQSLFAQIIQPETTLLSQIRYLEPITDEIITETLTYVSKDGENLDLDVYRPEVDADNERTTLIYLHGGGFQSGNRDTDEIKDFCTRLAQYGYVVASISYRLTRKDKEGGFGCDCPAVEKLNTFYAAVEDIQDATYFLIENREYLGINPYKIILAGSSAGAEAVLNAAYQPPYCYDLESGPVSYAGVVSMAGAIPDTMAIYEESAVPSLFFHGTDDKLVPYGTEPHHYCEKEDSGYLILHGPYTIVKKLEKLQVPFWLHTTCGGGHELAGKPKTEYFDEIVEFCYNYIVEGNGESRYTVIEGKSQDSDFKQYNFCKE